MKTIFLGSLLLWLSTATAQKKWVVHDSDFAFVLRADTGEGWIAVRRVTVYRLPRWEKIQTITLPENNVQDFGEGPFLIEDMNFDGHDDFRVVSITTTNFQRSFWFWFYDEDKHIFYRDTIYDGFPEISFDHKNKTVHYYSTCCIGWGSHGLYKWENGKLTLIGEEEGDDLDLSIPGPRHSASECWLRKK
ncbi:MAG TPA: hypothetical protein VI112_01320 [Bacteroidia bacterium]|jgi:hypothetical protein